MLPKESQYHLHVMPSLSTPDHSCDSLSLTEVLTALFAASRPLVIS